MTDTITIKTINGDLQADVIKRIQCFAIHKMAIPDGFSDDRFTLTHVPTGCHSGNFRHVKTCEDMAAKLLAFEFDWNEFTDVNNMPQAIKTQGYLLNKECLDLDRKREQS